MEFNFKRLLARGPEIIEAERVFIKEIPLQEFGLTFIYVLLAGLWCVFSDEFFDNVMGLPMHSPALETLKGINFVFATSLVLYLVLRRAFRIRRLADTLRPGMDDGVFPEGFVPDWRHFKSLSTGP